MTGDDDVRSTAGDPSTEEIPVVEQVAAATRTAVPDPVGAPRAALVAGSTLGDTDAELVAARALGDAGSLRAQRLEPRRALAAVVAAVWGAALLGTAIFAGAALYRVAPDVPRWLVAVAGVVCVAASVLLLSDVDPPSAALRRVPGYDSGDGRGSDGDEGDDDVTDPADLSPAIGRHELGSAPVATAGESDDFHELEWNRRQLFALRPIDLLWAAFELTPLLVFVAVLVTGTM